MHRLQAKHHRLQDPKGPPCSAGHMPISISARPIAGGVGTRFGLNIQHRPFLSSVGGPLQPYCPSRIPTLCLLSAAGPSLACWTLARRYVSSYPLQKSLAGYFLLTFVLDLPFIECRTQLANCNVSGFSVW